MVVNLQNKNIYSLIWLLFVLVNSIKIGYFSTQLISFHIISIFFYKMAVSTLLIVIIINVVHRFKYWKTLFVSFYVCQFVFIVFNLIYYKFFSTYFHVYGSITLVNEGLRASNTIRIVHWQSLVWVLSDLPIVILLITQKSKYKIIFSQKAVILSFVFLFLQESFAIFNKNSIFNKINSPWYSETAVVKHYGLIVNNIADIYRLSNEKKIISSLQYGVNKTFSTTYLGRLNIVIIQIESFFSRVIETKYKQKPIAPFLDSISHNSIYFPYTLTFHNAGGTTDCEFTVVNSLIPPETYPGIKLSTYNYDNSFVKILSKNGYQTLIFHGNNKCYFNRDVAFPKMGFRHYWDIYEMNLKEEGWGASDESLFEYVNNYMQTQEQPFCDYVITMSSHGPYTNVRRYYNNSEYDTIEDKTTKDYYNAISYLDQQLRIFIQNIYSKTPNTIVFIFGDHPAYVNDSNMIATIGKKNDYIFNFVPLIILTPSNLKKYDTTSCASLLDIAPTILNATCGGTIKTQGINLIDVKHSLENDSLLIRNFKYSRKDLFEIVKTIKK